MAQPRGRACFCLSKARPDGYSEAGEAGASQRLRSELEASRDYLFEAAGQKRDLFA